MEAKEQGEISMSGLQVPQVVKPIRDYSSQDLAAHLSDILTDVNRAYKGGKSQKRIVLFRSAWHRLLGLGDSIKEGVHEENMYQATHILKLIIDIATSIKSDIELLSGDPRKHGFIAVGLEELMPDLIDLKKDIISFHADLVDYRKKASRDGKKAKGISKSNTLRAAISFAASVLLGAEPHIFKGRSKIECARAIWIYISIDCCKKGTQISEFVKNKCFIEYEPSEDKPEDEFAGTLWRIEKVNGHTISKNPITFKKQFISSVSEVLEKIAIK
jgi:hypothetical protein